MANLLMAIRYEDDALKEQAVKKAEAKLKTKLTGYERGLIGSYLALLNHDAAGVNSGLTELCRGFQKSKAFGMTPFTRGFCIEAHAVYNLVCQAYDGDLLSAVTAPEEPNFCGDLAAYQREHHFAPGRVYNIFPDSLREFNTIMQCDPPDMHLYLQENDRLLDVDRFRTEVVHKLMQM